MTVSSLRWLGVALTTAYIGAIVWYFSTKTAGEQLWKLEPNNLGDTLAGTAGPLAFIWLVLGFFIQSKQLEAQVRTIEMQREELELQRVELRLQREETTRLANEAEKQRAAIQASELNARRDVFFREYDLVRQEIDRIALDVLSTVDSKKVTGMGSVYLGVGGENGLRSRYFAGERDLILNTLIVLCIGLNSAWFHSAVAQVFGEPILLKRIFDHIEQIFAQASDCDPTERLRRFFEFSNLGEAYFALSALYAWSPQFAHRKVS